MNIIILGDKYQKRMKSKGCVALTMISKSSNILDSQIKYIRRNFDRQTNIIYVYGFDQKRFLKNFYTNNDYKDNLLLIHNKDYDTYNYGHSLFLSKDYLNDDCIIFFGDTQINNKTFHKFDSNKGTQAFIKNKKNKLGCIIDNLLIQNISYDLDDNYIHDIYFLSQFDAQKLKSMLETQKYHNYFLFELINQLINNNSVVKSFLVND